MLLFNRCIADVTYNVIIIYLCNSVFLKHRSACIFFACSTDQTMMKHIDQENN